MKKLNLLMLLTMIAGAPVMAQDVTKDDWENVIQSSATNHHIVTTTEFVDRVGIGTQDPVGKLHITDIDPGEEGLFIFRDQTPFSMSGWENLIDISYDWDDFGTFKNEPAFLLNAWGKIGMGTRTPNAHLHIFKPTYQGSSNLYDQYLLEVESNNDNYTAFGVTNRGITHVGEPYNDASVTHNNRGLFEVWGTQESALDMNVNYLSSFRNWAGDGRVMRLKGGWPHSSNTTSIFQVESNGDYDEYVRFRILANGQVAIGDLNMNLPSGYKLLVEEGILTEKVRVAVKNSSNWADYVFEEDYELMPLNDVSNFIDENGHLPGVPSAEAVAESGIDVATMDATLLSKIEELTLHIIRQEEEMTQMRETLELLQQK